MKIPPINPKMLERTTTLKDGMQCSLKITSEAPRTFQFDMVELNSKKAVPAQYHLLAKKETLDSVVTNHARVMNKIENCCKDSSIVADIAEFFATKVL